MSKHDTDRWSQTLMKHEILIKESRNTSKLGKNLIEYFNQNTRSAYI